MKRGIAVAVGLSISIAANAQRSGVPDLMTVTANQYEQIFDGDPEDYRFGLVIFAKRIGQESQAAARPYICWPPGATYVQAGKVIDAYIEQHPQFLNYTMHDLTAAALILAFPCTQ